MSASATQGGHNKAIVDYTSPALCTPVTPFPQDDRVTDVGNMHNIFGKDRACGSAYIFADRQTDRQTDRHTHHNTSQPLPRAK